MKKLLIYLIIIFAVGADERKIKVAIDEWPPFRIIEGDLIYGIDIDLWNKIEKELDIEVEFERYPWGRALDKLQKGEVDAMAGLAYTEERAKVYRYAENSYYTCTTIFYTQEDYELEINSYNDLYKVGSIGYVIGSAYFDRFDKDNSLNKVEVATEEQLLKLLSNKRLEVIIGTECQVDYELKERGLSGKFGKSNYRPDNDVKLYVAFSKETEKIKYLNEIDQLIKKLNEERWIKEIEKKYF